MRARERVEPSVDEMRVAADTLHSYLDGPVWAAQRLQAQVIRARLDDSFQQLSMALRHVEDVLFDRFAGKCASIELDVNTALIFWRVKGICGLYVIGDDARLTPLCNAQLHVRKAACRLLPDLVVQLQEEGA